MTAWIPVAHLALCAAIVLWDVILAGRIARLRAAPPRFSLVTGLAGLLVLPALLIYLATSTALAGAALASVDWMWPAVVSLFALQAAYAVARRLVNPAWGIPIALYDLIACAAEWARWALARGDTLTFPALLPLAAERNALALVLGPATLGSPLFLLPPMIAPAFPALRKATATVRGVIAVTALAWVAAWAATLLPATTALRSYARHANARLRARPAGDFDIGLRILPRVALTPPASVTRSDLAFMDSLNVDAVALLAAPFAGAEALDSVGHTLDALHRDSLPVVVTVGYGPGALPLAHREPLGSARRAAVLRQVVRHLKPDLLFLDTDPYSAGAPIGDRSSIRAWQDYLAASAEAAHRTNPSVRVGILVSHFGARDSTLYAWAVQRDSPIDIIGVRIVPTRQGGRSIDAATDAVDRWMFAHLPLKDHWVFTGGFPLAHGADAQQDAVWAALAWGTDRQLVKGAIVEAAGDYAETMGLRSARGERRPVAWAVIRALRGLRESRAPSVTILSAP